MRVLVFFDLPVNTAAQRKAYREFRRFLTKEGYLMVQESVYSKLAMTDKAARSMIRRLQENPPKQGLVQVLKVTEKQYASMVFVAGRREETEELCTSERLVIL